ncbi:hypothetical protein DTO021D3_4924 [Paecilomyces variotii]|nr:hypothetical protein DTO021D3_4924 [Paecilomyces variotii]KAJ9345554.1 hypothetical protein DTO027B6_2085 [Paecilomyces variotii]
MSRDIHKAERSPPSAQPGWTVRNLWNLDRRLTDVLSAIRDPIFLFKSRGLATCCDISVESEYNSCKARIYCSVDFKTEKKSSNGRQWSFFTRTVPHVPDMVLSSMECNEKDLKRTRSYA